MILDRINGPENLKELEFEELDELANEIRNVLLTRMSATGGHFGSNFGMVEITIAMHYVFNSPVDKFVFDVSHQCYTHKILTGRKDSYIYKEKYQDVTGYTNPEESVHDIFNIGHTSTSISMACGLAKARDLRNTNENIVAVIGDGSLSGGEAFEGLDCAGELNSNLIVVINDNQMAIAENHGGLYKHLDTLRNSDGVLECNLFKALGFEYYYVDDGHDLQKLIRMFKMVKDTRHPVVLHICTKKGKGYKYAEDRQEDWHWRRPFNIEDGSIKVNYLAGENIDNIGREFLLDKIKRDPTISIVVAAVPRSIGLIDVKRKVVGKQLVDVGIAEEHAISMVAGLSKGGCKPVFVTDCTFYQRAYDQIAQDLCINNCPATLLIRNASVWGLNDKTHLGVFDIPLFRHIPNLVYLAPTTAEEYIAMLDWSLEQKLYPVAIRIPSNGVHHTTHTVDTSYDQLNKYYIEKAGKDIAIIAVGDFFQIGEDLLNVLIQEGYNPTLINPRFISGLDISMLEELKAEHHTVITLEDGILEGGFGQMIASYYGNTNLKVLNYGLKKEFLDRFKPQEVLEANRITVDCIVEDLGIFRQHSEPCTRF